MANARVIITSPSRIDLETMQCLCLTPIFTGFDASDPGVTLAIAIGKNVKNPTGTLNCDRSLCGGLG